MNTAVLNSPKIITNIGELLTPVILPPSQLNLRIVALSTYPPKKCGIATYTKDLTNAINKLNPRPLIEVIAMDDHTSLELEYPWEVSHRIKQREWGDWQKVLKYLNNSIIDVVMIQHEFGIYGWPDSFHLVNFIKKLNKPFVVTLHTVRENPTLYEKKIIKELVGRSLAVIVLMAEAVEILQRVYQVPAEKAVFIHHGAPDLPFFQTSKLKRDLGLSGKIVMSSINLVSPGKGFEQAIQALPEVVKKYPNLLYLIVGQTHPLVLAQKGEKYREYLQKLVKKLKLEENVRFVNEYVTLEKLIEYVQVADLYITPYDNLDQISSGSLAYAVAAGRLCIATPYRYAKEMLAGGRGYLVDPKKPEQISRAILDGLNHPDLALIMRQKCYALGRTMTWDRVGFRHIRMLDHLLSKKQKINYTKPSLDYLKKLTTEVGLLEHTYKGKPRLKEGYSLDDNARGLMVAISYGDEKLAKNYLDFLTRAEVGGLFYSDTDRTGCFVGKPTTGDHTGRAFWALSFAIRNSTLSSTRRKSSELLKKILPSLKEVSYIRTCAYILLGLVELKELGWDEMEQERDALFKHIKTKLEDSYQTHSSVKWRWIEDKITYDNGRIPQAILEAGRVFQSQDLINLGLKMLDFLIDQTFDLLGDHFRFVGNKGWLKKDGKKALFDEQPIEGGSMTDSCAIAYRITGSSYYKEMAQKAFGWYHGENIKRRSMFNPVNKSVYDGIKEDGINLNQGAEAILEYLLAYRAYVKLV